MYLYYFGWKIFGHDTRFLSWVFPYNRYRFDAIVAITCGFKIYINLRQKKKILSRPFRNIFNIPFLNIKTITRYCYRVTGIPYLLIGAQYLVIVAQNALDVQKKRNFERNGTSRGEAPFVNSDLIILIL